MTTNSKPLAKRDDPRHAIANCGPRIPYHPVMQEKFGIDSTAWKSLVEAVFPNATTMNSVVLALSYCKARRLDPFKRCVHIVPIWNSEQRCMVDTIWPGIGELRTTAFRTGEYAGRGHTEFGLDVTKEWESKDGKVSVTFPEWAQVTVFRMIKGQRVEFCGPRVYWLETYANKSRADSSPNSMWQDRPRGQIDKCAEAAALRAAFPEEIGGEFIPEEVQHDRTVINAPSVNIGESRTDSLMNKLAPTETADPEPESEATEATEATDTSEAELKAEWEAQQAKEAKEAGKLFGEPSEGHYADGH